jgi:hypothetical protein
MAGEQKVSALLLVAQRKLNPFLQLLAASGCICHSSLIIIVADEILQSGRQLLRHCGFSRCRCATHQEKHLRHLCSNVWLETLTSFTVIRWRVSTMSPANNRAGRAQVDFVELTRI